jgi:hypothetical protein
MKKIFAKHRNIWNKREFRKSVAVGIVFFVFSMVVYHFASIYVDRRASNYVKDLFLDNLPILDVDGILNYGVMAFLLFILSLLFLEPKRIPFVFKSTALFYLIRSAFITLTHLGPSPLESPIDPTNLFAGIIMGNDFFFSGHTGMPFLIALIFWDDKFIRIVSIAASLIFGAAVLLGHLHYSIDVFGAFFITYSIFHICQKFFRKDYKLFSSDIC